MKQHHLRYHLDSGVSCDVEIKEIEGGQFLMRVTGDVEISSEEITEVLNSLREDMAELGLRMTPIVREENDECN